MVTKRPNDGSLCLMPTFNAAPVLSLVPRRHPARGWALPALSGLLLAASFPNPIFPGLSPVGAALAWVALWPLLVSLDGASDAVQGFRRAWLAGAVFYALHCSWLPRAWPVGWPAWMTWAALAGYCALYPAFFGAAYAWMRRHRTPLEALWVPALWTLSETARAHLFTGIPAYSLGSSQALDPWLLPLAGVLGVAGLNFTLCLAALCLHRVFQRGWSRRESGLALAVALVLALTAALAPSASGPAQGRRTVIALLQGAHHRQDSQAEERSVRNIRIYGTLTTDAMHAGAKLLLWPEEAFPEDLSAGEARGSELTSFAKRWKLSILAGSNLALDDGWANAAVLINKTGKHQTYQKRHLVPFGEYMPFRDAHPLLAWWAERYDLPAFKPGGPATLFDADGLKLSPVLCYESLFGEDLREDNGGLLVVLANDAWFKDEATPNYHLMHSILRAVEGGRYVAHLVADGPSAVIGPDGRILQRLEQGERGYLLGEVDSRCGSPYRRWGWAFPWLCAGLVALALAINVLRSR